MKNAFAPGCALMLYKPKLATKVHNFLNNSLGKMGLYTTCCRNEPPISEKTNIINICPGCDKRFENNYELSATISLWEILAKNDGFKFPDYQGKTMTILDACPTRQNKEIHEAIRTLIKKMNIKLIEPKKTRTKSTCCGDSFYGELPVTKVNDLMSKRASEMPVNDVIVYCVSCTKSMFIGGKQPRYLVDLLFNEESIRKTTDTEKWHQELDEYIELN